MDKHIGIVVSVESNIAEVAMYEMVNGSNILWDGQLIPGPKVGSFISILQGNIRIIAKVISEKIIDQQNSGGSKKIDNRYSKDSINRIIKAKSVGTINGDKFNVTSRYVPMVGNKVSWINLDDYTAMYSLGDGSPALRIGGDLLGGQEVNISTNRFYASHIGIFGNSGSGKSNTLHRLYLNLFRSRYGKCALENSKFIVIDFNGEYSKDDSFGVDVGGMKEVINLSTEGSDGDLLYASEDDFLDLEIISRIFNATTEEQELFIKQAINNYVGIRDREGSYGNFFARVFRKMVQSNQGVVKNFIDEWADVYFELTGHFETGRALKNISFRSSRGVFCMDWNSFKLYFNNADDMDLFDRGISREIIYFIDKKFDQLEFFEKFNYFLRFMKIYECFNNESQKNFLDPLFKNPRDVLESLRAVVSINPSRRNCFFDHKGITIVNLLNVDRLVKSVIPLIVCKSAYRNHKIINSNRKNTTHLIIDEAHNILSSSVGGAYDRWRDYRLGVFEEIIKEGRKFGFYLTLSSQRPADISPSIVYQIHNYFIHRLVNDLDLQMIGRTMPTLDRASFEMIPSLGKGECVITGVAFSLPVFTLIDWNESDPRPHSDDLVLTDLWVEESNTDFNNQT